MPYLPNGMRSGAEINVATWLEKEGIEYEYETHKLILIVQDEEDDEWKKEVKEQMKRDNFFPNVWFLSDHGNYHPLTLE